VVLFLVAIITILALWVSLIFDWRRAYRLRKNEKHERLHIKVCREEVARDLSPEDKITVVNDHIFKAIGVPSVISKAKSAIWIATHGTKHTGLKAQIVLMHPLRKFSDADCLRESSRFLGIVLAQLLKELPPEAFERILKDQAESPIFDG
jgi:hypothetical protein